ncbi:MAG: oligopeptide transporter, OPT family [candidate division Zixibacteria bacterium]|nr:oligopeptide transporter, OPT family [candidate division Zixibacteria bacterium]
MSETPNADLSNKTDFKPYISADKKIPEVTIQAIILGALLSVVFGVANAYLGLKVGMTVSASIPAAVISMAILRGVLKRGTVLENNIVQTIGSAGESLAAGIIFTIPAFFIWNQTLEGFYHEVSQFQIIGLSLLGGSLGILFMIPLRKYLVEKEHNRLRFPEGTACAEIIVAGDEGGGKAKTVFWGMGMGALYKVLLSIAHIWPEEPIQNLYWTNNQGKVMGYKGGHVAIDATPALLGVGYIIGPKIAALMLGGAVLGYLGISPLLAYIGSFNPELIVKPGEIPLAEMDPGQLRNFYVKYLGVGAVALGGFVSLAKSIPVIVSSFATGFKQIMGKEIQKEDVKRTDHDLPMKTVLIGSAIIIFLIWLFPGTDLHILGAALAVIFGFFFVVVAARIVGIVGSSSSPVSGMTIATLLVTCLILLAFGVKGTSGMITAMSVGTVVCIAVCMSGDIAQDLKTGYLLGATPRKQQLTEFIGLIFPALAMGFTIYLLANAFGFVADATHPAENVLEAPQANVMAVVVQGVMNADLPWTTIIIGIMIAGAIELVGISSLPFAIGLYLPLALSTPIMAGGIISAIVRKTSKPDVFKRREEKGVLFGSGLVAGDALIGVLSAGLIVAIPAFKRFNDANTAGLVGDFGPWLSLIAFLFTCYIFWNVTRVNKKG